MFKTLQSQRNLTTKQLVIVGNVNTLIANNIKNTTNSMKSNNVVNNTTSVGSAKNSISSATASTTPSTTSENTASSYQKYTFTNDFGSGDQTKVIEANDCIRLSGFAGASSNVYYLKDGNLYHMTLAEFETKLIATNISKINFADGYLNAYKTSETVIKSDDNYVKYI